MDNQPLSQRSVYFLAAGMLVLGIAIAAATVVMLTDEPRSTTVEILPPLPTHTPTQTLTPAPLQVYIIGAVAIDEARVMLPPGSRVGDAIDAAGGALPNADLRRVNLAAPVQDGQMIVVPFETAPDTEGVNIDPSLLPTNPPPASAATGTLVDVNTASAEALEQVNGIGPALAGRIIEYREANGPFTSVDDLINVSGIGEATLENMRPFITVNN